MLSTSTLPLLLIISAALIFALCGCSGTEAVESGGSGYMRDYLLTQISDEDAQRIIGDYGYRPSDEEILKEYSDKFDLGIKLCNIDDFGGWDAAYDTFFKDGGVFDEIYGN